MTTRHLVDAELVPILDQFPTPVYTPEALPLMRAQTKEMLTQMAGHLPKSPDISVSEHLVPGPDGSPEVRVLVYMPTNRSILRPAILWIHGGGYIMGSPEQEDLTVKNMVSAIGCVAVSVDYRLAPETPHPGPVEDCYAVLHWVHSQADELGIDTSRIAIGGASAGGGLAAALGLLARDRGKIPVAFQLLIQPMLDDRTCTLAEDHSYTGEFVWTRDANRFGWRSLLAQEPGLPGVSSYAAAARAEQLEGLPPTFINAGALDLFLEEDMEYARRLIRAGVPTEFHVYPGAYHGFRMVADAQVTQTATRDQITALKRTLSDPDR